MPRSLVQQLMDAFSAAILAQEQQAFDTMLDAWQLVEDNLWKETEALAIHIDQLVKDGKRPSPAKLAKLDRVRALLIQAQAEVTRFSNTVAAPITEGLQSQLVNDAIEHSEVLVSTALKEAGRLNTTFDRLPTASVEKLIGISGDGSPLRDLLVTSYDQGAQGILDELLKGVAKGQNPQVVARNVIRSGVSRSLSRMMTIARTESLRAYREATHEGYKASKVVESWVRLETLDSRVCAGCLAVHGKEYELSTSFEAHPNCRGAMIPKVADSQVVVESGEDWFAKQPRARQLDIMGDARLDYIDGGGDFGKLATERKNSTWGNAVVPRSITDLVAE